ncbi:hypothetical protein K438DRAFT_2016830 [Mycena galopus ATCC 62051]|nr:hypothetical protein K438DRAFT_2016830 [Mycena galopus ATCC 62051]
MADSQLYSRLLLPTGHGYPLFHPQPFDDLPLESRQVGTEIGDVGVVTSDGSFDPIFNICRAADDPLNRFGVPEGFERVNLCPKDITLRELYHLPGSNVSTDRVGAHRANTGGSDVSFQREARGAMEIVNPSKEAAILQLPDGALRTDLRNFTEFRDCALKNAHHWYEFVNSDLERIVENGDLYLVTGTDKASSWSVAAVEYRFEDHGSIASEVEPAGRSHLWESQLANPVVHSGPRRHAGEELWGNNQTVFLRGFKVAIRSSPPVQNPLVLNSEQLDLVRMSSQSLPAGSQAAIEPDDYLDARTQASVLTINTSGAPYLTASPHAVSVDIIPSDWRIRFNVPGTNNSLESEDPETPTSGGLSDDEAWAEFFPRSSKLYHPSSVINEYLLDSSPEATVAVTHDHQWMSVLNENDSQIPCEMELIQRICHKYQVNLTTDGVWLQEPIQAYWTPVHCEVQRSSDWQGLETIASYPNNVGNAPNMPCLSTTSYMPLPMTKIETLKIMLELWNHPEYTQHSTARITNMNPQETTSVFILGSIEMPLSSYHEDTLNQQDGYQLSSICSSNQHWGPDFPQSAGRSAIYPMPFLGMLHTRIGLSRIYYCHFKTIVVGNSTNLAGSDHTNALATKFDCRQRIVDHLIDHQTNGNLPGGIYGNALIAAYMFGLSTNGADMRPPDRQYHTYCRSELQTVHLLIENGANAHMAGGRYQSALAMISYGDHTSVLIYPKFGKAFARPHQGQIRCLLVNKINSTCVKHNRLLNGGKLGIIRRKSANTFQDGEYHSAMNPTSCHCERNIGHLLDKNSINVDVGDLSITSCCDHIQKYILIESSNAESHVYPGSLFPALMGYDDFGKMKADKEVLHHSSDSAPTEGLCGTIAAADFLPDCSYLLHVARTQTTGD